MADHAHRNNNSVPFPRRNAPRFGALRLRLLRLALAGVAGVDCAPGMSAVAACHGRAADYPGDPAATPVGLRAPHNWRR